MKKENFKFFTTSSISKIMLIDTRSMTKLQRKAFYDELEELEFDFRREANDLYERYR